MGNPGQSHSAGAPSKSVANQEGSMRKKKGSGSGSWGPALSIDDGPVLLVLAALLVVPVLIVGAAWLAWRLGIIVSQVLLGRCFHERHAIISRPEHGIRFCDRCEAWQTARKLIGNGGVAETELGPWQPKEASPGFCWHSRPPVTRKIEDFNIDICQQCGCWRRWAVWEPAETCPGLQAISRPHQPDTGGIVPGSSA